jgi:hypothetical protein
MASRLSFIFAIIGWIAPALGDDVVRAGIPNPDPLRQYFFLPPHSAVLAAPVVAAAGQEAERLFALGKAAADAGRCTEAARLAYAVLHENPDHEPARKLLGYRKLDGRWVTEFGASMQRAGSTWHEQFGWLPTAHVARYEAGERYLNGRWVPAADDAAFRTTLEKGWKIDTEHFRLTTNVSLEEGVRLAGRLESLYHVWRQLFARYHTPAAEWKRLYDGGEPRKLPPKRYPVKYYRSKDEYVAALKKREPRIEMTSGIFMNDDDTAYFYADEKVNNDGFLYHEVVHELFMLTRPTTQAVATKGNFWLVEGIACYFESLRLHDGYAELGDVTNARLHAARYRRLVDDFYVPLAELTTFSLQKMQADERLPRLYSQASGLAWYLMHAHDGRLREPTVEYLSTIYAGSDSAKTLAEKLGRSYDQLDRDYLSYLQSLPNPNPQP